MAPAEFLLELPALNLHTFPAKRQRPTASLFQKDKTLIFAGLSFGE
jgi:hypothetical protein